MPSIKRLNLAILFLVALGFRIVFVYFSSQELIEDEIWYDRAGINLADNHGFSVGLEYPYEPEIFRTPVYPFFLSVIYRAFGHCYPAVKIAQAIIGSLTVLIVYFMCATLFRPGVAYLAGFIFALYPFDAYYSGFILMETVFTFLLSLFMLAFLLFLNKRTNSLRIMAGLTLGLATFCRPVTLLLPLFILFLLLLLYKSKKAALKDFLVITVFMGLVILPWSLRNFFVFKGIYPLQVEAGMGFYHSFRDTETSALKNAYQYLERMEDLPQDVRRKTFLEKYIRGRDVIAHDQRLMRLAKQKIKAHPIRYFFICVKRSWRVWVSMSHRKLPFLLTRLATLTCVSFLLFALCGVWAMRHDFKRIAPFLMIIFYFTFVHSFFIGAAQYTIPVRPYLIILSTLGFVNLFNNIFKKWSPLSMRGLN